MDKAAEIVAAAGPDKQVVVGPHKPNSQQNSFSNRWAEQKLKSLELDTVKFEFDKDYKNRQLDVTNAQFNKRLLVDEAEVEIKKQRLEVETKNFDKQLEYDAVDKEKTRSNDLKTKMILECIRAGKTPAEAKEFVDLFV